VYRETVRQRAARSQVSSSKEQLNFSLSSRKLSSLAAFM